MVDGADHQLGGHGLDGQDGGQLRGEVRREVQPGPDMVVERRADGVGAVDGPEPVVDEPDRRQRRTADAAGIGVGACLVGDAAQETGGQRGDHRPSRQVDVDHRPQFPGPDVDAPVRGHERVDLVDPVVDHLQAQRVVPLRGAEPFAALDNEPPVLAAAAAVPLGDDQPPGRGGAQRLPVLAAADPVAVPLLLEGGGQARHGRAAARFGGGESRRRGQRPGEQGQYLALGLLPGPQREGPQREAGDDRRVDGHGQVPLRQDLDDPAHLDVAVASPVLGR